MKSKLLLVSMLSWGAVASAQSQMHSAGPRNVAGEFPVLGIESPLPGGNPSIIEYGDTVYSNDFSDSGLFTQINSVDTAVWEFGTEATVGHGPAPFVAFNSTTAANGYAIFDSDGYGQNVPSDASITTGPINLTNATAPITLNFEQYYARFADEAIVLISTDGTNFTAIGDNSDVPVLNAGGGSPTANPDFQSIVISQYAGQTIWIRFQYIANWDWVWMIDDITITEVILTPNDLAVTGAWSHNNFTSFSYAQIPANQIDSLGFTLFLTNNGGSSQNYSANYEVSLNGTVVSSGTANTDSIVDSFEADTLYATTDFVPTETGVYTIKITLVPSLGVDVTPADDTASVSVEITDFLYSPIPADLTEADGAYGYSGDGPEFVAWKIGQLFTIETEQTLKAIDIGLAKAEGFTGTQDFLIEVYDASAALTPGSLPISIGDYHMTEDHSDTEWTTVFIEPIILDPSKTYLAVVGYPETNKPMFINSILEDDDEGTRIYGPFNDNDGDGVDDVDWYRGSDLSPAIRLNFADDAGVDDHSSALSNIVVSPNPANTFVKVSLTLETPGSYDLRLMDINGRVVYEKSQSSKVTSVSETVYLENLSAGIYTLQVISGSGVASSKVVVAH